MKMKKALGGMAIAIFASTVATAADLPAFEGDVTVAQDASRQVTIDYMLGTAPAVVTVDILTNGVSIGAANFANYMSGDVNRLVQTGARKIYWRPDRDWPGHKFTDGEVSVKLRAWPVDDPPPYMIVNLAALGAVEYRADAEGVPGGINSATYKTTKMVLRRIPAMNRNWQLGTLDSSLEGAATAVPYTATFTNDCYIGVFPMTVGQYVALGGADPYTADERSKECSYWKNNEHPLDHTPVFNVSHANALALMSGAMKTRSSGVDFTLPTEAQWETACRAGTTTATYLGDTPGAADLSGYSCSPPYQGQVGTKPCNAWGMYDMLGKMMEYCRDWYADRTTDDGAVKTDPVGPASGTYHVTKSSNTADSRHSGYRSTDQYFGQSWAKRLYTFRCSAPARAK